MLTLGSCIRAEVAHMVLFSMLFGQGLHIVDTECPGFCTGVLI